MPGVCVHPIPLEPLDEGSRILDMNGLLLDEAGHVAGQCLVKQSVRIARPVFGNGWDQLLFAHNSCAGNEYAALRQRVLGVVPRPDPGTLNSLRITVARWGRFTVPTPALPPDWPARFYSGGKRAHYLRFVDRVHQGVKSRSARLNCFLKFDYMKFSAAKPNAAARCIQYSQPEYSIALGCYTKAFEHFLYDLAGDDRILPAVTLCGKGKSQGKRCAVARQHWLRLRDPVAISLDASAFDKHVSRELLEIEFAFYRHFNADPRFHELLSWQLDNYGKTKSGFRYWCRGRRASGTMNTALGNCVLMMLMVATWLRDLPVTEWSMLDDGDDVVVFLETKHLQWALDTVGPIFDSFGMSIRVDNIAHIFEQIDWCQCKPIEYSPGRWKFVRHWLRVFARSCSGSKYYTTPSIRGKLVNTIGLAELILNLGVPILQEYALALIRNSNSSDVINFTEADSMYYRVGTEMKAMKLQELSDALKLDFTIMPEARLSFQRAFGVSPHDQCAIEGRLRDWAFDIHCTDFRCAPIDISQGWKYLEPYDSACYPLD